MTANHHRDLDWAYLPVPAQKRRTRLSYIKLGESFALRGLGYRDVVIYMSIHSAEMSQSDRDAMDGGYNRAVGRGLPSKKLRKPVPKVKAARRKPVRRKKPRRKSRRKPAMTDLQRTMYRYTLSVAKGGRLIFPRVDSVPSGADLAGLVKARGLPITWREVKRRYPNYIGSARSHRRLAEALIDREYILYQLASAPSLRALLKLVRQLLRDRIALPLQERRRLADLAKSSLADSKDEPSCTGGE